MGHKRGLLQAAQTRVAMPPAIERVEPWRPNLNIHFGLGPLVSLLAGILILLIPRLLNTIVAVYLIVIGLIGLFGAGQMHL